MTPPFDRNAALAALVAVLLPIVLYLPTLSFGFVFDDRPLLIENPVVQAPRGLGEILTTDLDPAARAQEAPTTNYLRPLFLGLAAGLYAVFGANPVGWHLMAVLMHGLLGGLAFWLLRREGLGIVGALAASLLFSAHPSHVQSAAWISGIQDLLFALLAILAYLAYRASAEQERPRISRLAPVGVAYAVALLAKEPAVGLLLFVGGEACWQWWLARHGDEHVPRRPWAELGVLAGVTGAYFVYRWSVFGGLAHRFPTAPRMAEALASVPVAVAAYLRDLLLPVDLFLLHPARPVSSWLAPKALISLAVVLAVTALAIGAIRKRPELARPFLFFAAWLAPTLALWAINPEWMVMDRYLLLPSLALGWALVVVFPLVGRGRRVTAALLIGAFAALSLLGMRVFRSEETFWNAAVEADSGSSSAWTGWAKLRSEAGDLTAAGEGLEKAIALDPQAQLPRLRRALLALRNGQPAAAVSELDELTRRNPSYLPAWRNLVVAYDRAGDGAGAWSTLERALALFPNDPLLWSHRAVVLRGAGRREEALAAIRQAAALAPRDATIVLREALLLAELGRRDEAGEAARRGLALDPPPEVRTTLESLVR
jgi:Flp pilus assembly protein TadD